MALITITTPPRLYGFTASFINDDQIDVVEVWQLDVPGGQVYAQVVQSYAPDETSLALSVTHQSDVEAAYAALGYTVSF